MTPTVLTDLAVSPALPLPLIVGLGIAALLVLSLAAFRRARGTALRGLAMAALFLALLDPHLVEEKREPLTDMAVVVVDQSRSQRIGDRTEQAEKALAGLSEALNRQEALDVRVVRAGEAEAAAGPSDAGTQLFSTLGRALADIPRQRLAGVVLLTDGQVHDVPSPESLDLGAAPLHVLLTGRRKEADRRLIVEQAPSFGIVDQTAQVTVRVADAPDRQSETVRLTVRRDGGAPEVVLAPVGEPHPIDIPLEHGGPTVVELEVEAAPNELTAENNRAVVSINGVRDRLRVLLVSGEPHAGERTWRTLLKSDPSVDLVHFTILRPPEKDDMTPLKELALIAFPIRELFQVKLNEFDLIIFDRYRRRGILPSLYLSNIADYVRQGGAVLVASGPEQAGEVGVLEYSPLGDILPAQPGGSAIERGYRPTLSETGRRHPVTAGLPGAGEAGAEPTWGRWFRTLDAAGPLRGTVLMEGAEGKPILVLDRVGEGRVAQLLTDQIWLWARGYEGGGPQAELLRRLAHWLMKEPDLEENDLRARVESGRIVVERRSLEAGDKTVTLTEPSGAEREVVLKDQGDGRAVAAVPANEVGLYRVSDGERTALAAVGAINPVEMADVRTTPEKLAPVVEKTGGGAVWLPEAGVPEVRRVRPERAAAGSDWIGMRANGDYVVTGITQLPLLPAGLALLACLGLLVLAWRREGR